MRVLSSALLAVLLTGSLIVACGGGGSAFGDSEDGGKSGGKDAAGLPNLGTPTGTQRLCSGDLRDVIDEKGVVVQTCPADQGCAGGVCVPACSAAAASKGSVGCDYIVPTPSFNPYFKAPCFAAFVANAWPGNVKLTVARDGITYDVTQFGRIAENGTPVTAWSPVPSSGVPSGKVAVLFLSDDPESVRSNGPLYCPIPPALRQTDGTTVSRYATPEGATGRGKAWHITADAPVTVYDILPFGGASSWLPSAELLYPTTAWGKNYLGIVPFRGDWSPQWGQIVAAEDDTQVTVLPNVDLPFGPKVVAAPKNVASTFTLSAGEYIQWQDSGEMSGTVFQATKPFSFFGGLGYNCYTSTTSTGGGCDSAHQELPPISAFGSEYAIAPYTTRRADLQPESVRYRIVGGAADTQLTFSPPIAQAPSTLALGSPVDFETTSPFVVTSQDAAHPFFVAQVMTGCFVKPEVRSPHLGDEEHVNVIPPAQWLKKYVFFTDPSYGTTNLVLTRRKSGGAFQDVTVDCAGPLTGWKPVGTSGDYEMTDLDLVRTKIKNGACDNGPHVASSAAPFGLVVWGLDEWASYAYPAGGNTSPINAVVVPAIPK